MRSNDEVQHEFRKDFRELCKALITDSVEINQQRYWCPWSEGNQTVKNKFYPRDEILRGLAHMQVVSSVRLSNMRSSDELLPMEWQKEEKWWYMKIYLIRDLDALKKFSKECPVKSVSEWAPYWKRQEKAPPKEDLTFDEALTGLIAAMERVPDPTPLVTKVRKRISEISDEPCHELTFDELLTSLVRTIRASPGRTQLTLKAAERIIKEGRKR